MDDDPKKTDEPTPDDVAAENVGTVSRPAGVEISQEDRIAGLIKEAQKRAPPQVAEFLRQAGPILVPVINVAIVIFNIVGPLYVKLAVAIYTFLNWLPWDLFEAAMGLGLCFFGGGYCASIAAVEAFLLTGWPVTKRHLTEVYESAMAVIDANESDDKKDDDGDGIADVKQIPTSQLIDRKVRVAAQAVKDPQKLAAAIGGLYTGWLSVQASLRIKFARTITLAISCATLVEYYVIKALLPVASPFVAPEFVHWLPTAFSTATRGLFLYFAWKLQEMVSAVQSGLRGGLMFTRGLLAWMNKQGVKNIGPISLESDHTYIDEVLGYMVAACGVYVQWNLGFGMPFPFSLIMFPLDIIEWYIRYSVATGATPGV